MSEVAERAAKLAEIRERHMRLVSDSGGVEQNTRDMVQSVADVGWLLQEHECLRIYAGLLKHIIGRQREYIKKLRTRAGKEAMR